MADHVPLARAVLAVGLLLGIAADALLRQGPGGLGFLLWIALAALSGLALAGRAGRRVPREALAWFLAAIAFAAAMCWRGDQQLQFLNFVATVCALGMAATVIAGTPIAGIFGARVRDLVAATAVVLGDIVGGTPRLVARDGALRARGPTRRVSGARALARAVVITVPIVGVLAALLVSADPIFATLVRLPPLDPKWLVSHALMIGCFAWLSAGWGRRVALAEAGAGAGAGGSTVPDVPAAFALGTTDVAVLLGSMIVLFTAFMSVQLGWLFGGAAFLEARAGLTVAQYARRGFFELLWVALIVSPVLLGTRALVSGDATARRWHARLAFPLIVLVCAMMGSAVERMRLYVGYFGLTSDRFFALAFMGWLAVVLVWLALTVLRDRGAPFVGGSVLAGLAAIVVLDVADPSAIIARTNLGRPATAVVGRPRDVNLAYLARLRDGAVPLVIHALLDTTGGVVSDPASRSDRCRAALRLLSRPAPVTWQQWNAGDASAAGLIQLDAPGLRAVAHGCPTPGSTSPAM